MKILFATDQYFPTVGGISMVTYRLAKSLTKFGHRVAIIAPSTSLEFKKETSEGFTIFRVRSFSIFKTKNLRYAPTFLYKNKIKNIIKTFSPDIVHLETPNDIATVTAQIAKKLSIPIIGTCHVMPENISGSLPFLPSRIRRAVGNLYMRQMTHIFNQIDFVTAPTQTGIAILKAYGIKTPCMALSNGIDLEQFRDPAVEQKKATKEKLKLPDVPIILYIGRLDKEKRVSILLKALGLIPGNVRFHALIAGEGNEVKLLKKIASKSGLNNKITFMGLIPRKDLPVLYGLAFAFVMPSTAELQSLVTMEAMALKLPIIGAKAGALPYLIEDNKNGFLFEPDNPDDLAQKLTMLLKDKKLGRQMGEESFRLIQKHDINAITKILESLYLKIIKEKKEKFPRI